MLEVTRGNKDEVGDLKNQCSPAGTVVTGWDIIRDIGEQDDTWRREKSWAMVDPDLDSLQKGQSCTV